jgi:anti-sigma factor RsiW
MEPWGFQMTCSRELIEALVDEELDSSRAADVQEHISQCSACSELLARLERQREEIRSLAPSYAAPPALRRLVREAVRRESADRQRPPAVRAPWRLFAIAASILLCLSLGWNLTGLRQRSSASDTLANDILSNHVRSLMATHLFDVPSSDQHTVKPWFNGKLDFSPQVKDLSAEGFPLAGGRLEYTGGRSVAVLVYRRRQHVVNLYTWPSVPERDMQLSRQGYNLLHWSDGGMSYWAVSDIPSSELQQFREAYRK